MKTNTLVTSLALVAFAGVVFSAAIPDVYAGDKGAPFPDRKITMKVDMWQNIENVSEKGGADKFWITLKSGKEIFCNILSWGRADVHVMLLNHDDGRDDGYDMIINKGEIAAITVQMRNYD